MPFGKAASRRLREDHSGGGLGHPAGRDTASGDAEGFARAGDPGQDWPDIHGLHQSSAVAVAAST